MDGRTATSFDPHQRTVVVFGQRLRRLTLRHLFTLQQMESPLVGAAPEGHEWTAGEMLLAVRVLGARSERELSRVLALPEHWWGRVRIWAQAARGWFGFGVGYLRLKRWMGMELEAMPVVLPGPRMGRYQTEMTVFLASRLVREMGCSMEAAWWRPAAEAAHLRLAWEEQDGKDFRVLTEELQEELEEMGHQF